MILPALQGFGAAAGGISSLVGAFGIGGQQQQQQFANYDLSPLYASLLLGDNAVLSAAGQEMGAFLGQLNATEGIQNQIGYNTTMGQFNEAMNQQRQATGLTTGIASQLAGNAIGLATDEARAKLAAQMGGVQNSLAMRQDERDAKKAYDALALQGSSNLMNTGLTMQGQLGLAGVNNATSLSNTGLTNANRVDLAGLQNQANLLSQANELRARQQETGLREYGATARTGIQAMAGQQNQAMTNEMQLLMQGLRGTQDLQQTQAKGEIQAGMGAQSTSNQLAGAQGLSNVQIGQSQEQLRNELLKLQQQTDSDIYKGSVANIQGGQRAQELLRGEGTRQSQLLVGQTDQQRQIQEDKYAGEGSLIAGQSLANTQNIIGQTAKDQTMLYGNLQADKVRTDMQQGGAVERAREDFSQKFALQDAAFKQDMSKKRYGARMAMAGQRAFA